MNSKDEKTMKLYKKALKALHLEAENKKPAKRYLETEQPEDPSLLEEVDKTLKVVSFLEDSLISIALRIYTDVEQGLTDQESNTLKKFLRESDPDANFPKEIEAIFHKYDCQFEDAYLIAKAGFLAMEHSVAFSC